MAKQLNIEDLLEMLEYTKHPKAPEIRTRLERLTQDAADLVASEHKVVAGIATWQGKVFAGCCCPIYARNDEQTEPPIFRELEADLDGDWETEDGEPVEERPIGVGVFIIGPDDKTLMSKRIKASSYVGFWQNPGGKLECQEDPRVCAQREVKEETGLSFTSDEIRAIATTEDRYPDGTAYSMIWYVIYVKEFPELPPNPEPEKHTDWEWVDYHQMVDLQQKGLLINSTFSVYVRASCQHDS
jgi:8-oxo-dGTP diphosphatase